MTDLFFHPLLVLRVPVYSFTNYTEAQLEQVLKQPLFQKAIFFTSDVFYNELKKANFELSKLDEKAVGTVKKYFNRMCYRPTPFGLCAAVGSLPWGGDPSIINLSYAAMRPHLQFSYKKNEEYVRQILATQTTALSYQLDRSLYSTGKEYRFIRSGQNNAQVDFIVDSLKPDALFKKLVTYLNKGRLPSQIASYISAQTGCSDTDAQNYMQWLIDHQLIRNQLEANITGQDHLARVLASTEECFEPFEQLKQITAINDLALDGALKSADFYVNLQTDLPGAQLNTRYQQDILDGIYCLDHLTTALEPPGIKDFVKNFTQRFEGQCIPLLLALDPETGIGYGGLAVEDDDGHLLKDTGGMGNPAPVQQLFWSDAHALLLNKWKNNGDNKGEIVLDEDDLRSLNKDKVEDLAPSLSIMFRIVDNKVYIEQAGGVCAASLIGRFTPFDTGIDQLAIDMARHETTTNPDVIFAEIAHICHNHTANIDRREHIYPYEIPVLVHSTMKPEQQIPLSDLWVSVVGGNVVLWSKAHQKRVIPRLSSAFNYTRNDLAIFRFLCDLQHVGIKTSLNLKLSNFFPAQSFYPRVSYKNTIVHLASWHFKQDIFAQVLQTGVADRSDLFAKLRSQLGLPKMVALTQHDNQLVFNLDVHADVLFLLETLRGQEQVTLKEFLLPDSNDAIVKNEHNEPYINQFVASVYHKKQVYQSISMPDEPAKRVKRNFIPGGEWLYLKIYCHPVRSNELLTMYLGPAIKRSVKTGQASAWFFIRYNDPSYHIRLRLKVASGQQQQILNSFYKTIEPLVHDGLISKYSIDTYERELERYGNVLISDAEYAFYASSNLSLSFLLACPAPLDAKQVLEFALVSVTDILATAKLDVKTHIGFFEHIFNSFAKEFSIIADLSYQLDIQYRKQKTTIEEALKNTGTYYGHYKLNIQRRAFIDSLTKLYEKVPKAKTVNKEKLIADMIHMHLNRLFINDARRQEMAVYYFLLKHLRSALARSRSGKVDG